MFFRGAIDLRRRFSPLYLERQMTWVVAIATRKAAPLMATREEKRESKVSVMRVKFRGISLVFGEHK